MELTPDHLRVAARRWDTRAAELREALVVLRGASTAGLGGAATEAAQLLAAAEEAVSRLGSEAERLVDGLLHTSRSLTDTDEAVAAALMRVRSAG